MKGATEAGAHSFWCMNADWTCIGTLQACHCAGSRHQLSGVEAFLTGALARTMAAAATCPFTIIKTRMEYSGSGRILYSVRCLLTLQILAAAAQP